MIHIKEINNNLIEDCVNFLYSREEFSQTISDWRKMLSYKWKLSGFPYGYAMLEKGEVKGVLLTVFSERLIDKKIHVLCNLSTWVVNKDYRFHSLKLIAPLLKDDRITITDLSPIPTVQKILCNLGFSLLDDAINIIPILPCSIFSSSKKMEFIKKDKEINEALSKSEKIIFEHHITSRCRHAVFRKKGEGIECCYIIYKIKYKYGLKFIYIQYFSDKPFLCKYFQEIKTLFFKHEKAVFIMIDSRFDYKEIGRKMYRYKWIKLYRSNCLNPREIDNLYSENIILNI